MKHDFLADEDTDINAVPPVEVVPPVDARPYYGIIINFGVMNDRENGRILGLPRPVHSLPALAWYTVKAIWKNRNLLRGRPT